MKKENIKILEKLNKLIDREAGKETFNVKDIKGCLSYMICYDYLIYCQINNCKLLDSKNLYNYTRDNYINVKSTVTSFPNGVEIYTNFQLQSYSLLTKTMGGENYLCVSVYPYLERDDDGEIIKYVESPLMKIFEDISFRNLDVDGIAIETNDSTYYIDKETIDELLENREKMRDDFVCSTKPKMEAFYGTILNPRLCDINHLKISTDNQYSDAETFVVDLDDNYEIIENNLIRRLNESKENEGPQIVSIQISCPRTYNDIVSNLVDTIYKYLENEDDYYRLISFISLDSYYYGYISALIKSHYDGFNYNDIHSELAEEYKDNLVN